MSSEQNRRDPATITERRAAVLSAYADVVACKEELARRTRIFEGYKLLALSGLVLGGETVSGAEKEVAQWLR